ncbi:MAG: hypothetical protein ACKVU1_15780 [bacterium]
MGKDNFDVIILNGRPAAGKSEVIDYLKKVPVAERLRRFHIGEFEEFDDFPILWERFEDDDIFSRYGRPRAHTTDDYYFKEHFFWNFLIERLNLAYNKTLRDDPKYHDTKTAIIEFSRGGENGFEEAYGYLDPQILKRAGIVYIKVSYEESKRKNQRRANKDRPDSILQHSLPDEKMDFYYKTNDWEKLAGRDPRAIDVKGVRVPYSVLENEPEVTDNAERLGQSLERVFAHLWTVQKGAR